MEIVYTRNEGKMKHYNIEEIERSINAIADITEEIKPILKANPAFYAKKSGYDRQYIHQFVTRPDTVSKKNTDPRRVIHLYKIIMEGEK